MGLAQVYTALWNGGRVGIRTPGSTDAARSDKSAQVRPRTFLGVPFMGFDGEADFRTKEIFRDLQALRPTATRRCTSGQLSAELHPIATFKFKPLTLAELYPSACLRPGITA